MMLIHHHIITIIKFLLWNLQLDNMERPNESGTEHACECYSLRYDWSFGSPNGVYEYRDKLYLSTSIYLHMM